MNRYRKTNSGNQNFSNSKESNSWIKRKMKKNISVSLIVLIAFIFLILSITGYNSIVGSNIGNESTVYKAIGFVVIMIWTCVFLSYFIWAIYFYNINYGITNDDWKRIEEAREKRIQGLPYNQEELDEEPISNPYNEETFGLPPGTVRGMIAFTLLVGALGLLIVSFGMDNKMDEGGFFYDNFEFFKTAFLMMIAFYFGSRSLKYLRKDGAPKPVLLSNSRKEYESVMNSQTDTKQTDPIVYPKVHETIIAVHREGDVVPTSKDGIPHIVATDPMMK